MLDRVEFQGEGRDAHIGVRYVLDERTGGQTAFKRDEVLTVPLYGLGIDNEMVDVFGKHGFIFKGDATKSIGMIGSLRNHTVDAFFGRRTYTGIERSGTFNAIYQQLLRDGNDQMNTGLSFTYFDYTVEHTLKRGSFTAVSGLRVDHEMDLGTFASPRLHLKYDLGPLSALRASAGHGWRTANPFVENASVLASSRTVIVEGQLGAERSWNFGIGALHKFKWLQRKWAFGLDAYRTEFTDQVVADMDRSAHQLVLYMLNGPSYANTVQADMQVELARPLQLKLAYRWYDARTTYDGRLLARPFVPEHRAMRDVCRTSLRTTRHMGRTIAAPRTKCCMRNSHASWARWRSISGERTCSTTCNTCRSSRQMTPSVRTLTPPSSGAPPMVACSMAGFGIP
jgi:outer membrane receptor protein involved in Fe transport